MVAQMELDPIRVLCVDDNVIIGMAMCATIDATDGMRCVDCLERADTLLETVAELRRDVTRDHPNVAVIVLSGSGDSNSRDEALAAGARSYLIKGGGSQS